MRPPTLLLLLVACTAPPPAPPPPALELTVEAPGALADGARLRPGTELRFTLRSQARSFVVIAAALEGGEVLPLLPASGEPLELPAGSVVRLQESISLPPREQTIRFVAVACDIRPPVEPIWATIAERLRAVGGDPAKLPPLGLESCREAQRLVRFVDTPR